MTSSTVRLKTSHPLSQRTGFQQTKSPAFISKVAFSRIRISHRLVCISLLVSSASSTGSSFLERIVPNTNSHLPSFTRSNSTVVIRICTPYATGFLSCTRTGHLSKSLGVVSPAHKTEPSQRLTQSSSSDLRNVPPPSHYAAVKWSLLRDYLIRRFQSVT